MRMILGPVQCEEGWRIRNYKQLEKLVRGEDIFKYIEYRKTTEWIFIGMRSKGRPKSRLRDKVLNDLRKLKVKNWTYKVVQI